MFQHFYTTAMCSQKKQIEKRFTMIRQKNARGRIHSAVSMLTLLTLLVTTVFAGGVMADEAGIYGKSPYEVLYQGQTIELTHQPFVSNQELYLPLREVLNGCGVANEDIWFSDNTIGMNLFSPVQPDTVVAASIKVGEQGIRFDLDSQNLTITNHSGGIRTTSHPVILKDGVTYVPLGILIRLKHFDVQKADEADEIDSQNRYTQALNLKLLEGLEIRQYDNDGKFDVLLHPSIDIYGEGRFSPEYYYQENEKVLIGTVEEQESFGYSYTSVNGYYFPESPTKRILVDDNGKVLAVVLWENQKHEALNDSGINTFSGTYGWDIFSRRQAARLTSSEQGLVSDVMIHDPATSIAGATSIRCFYIPADLQPL